MLSNVTLILILHNRHKNLDRLLNYYQDCNFPIIIADSSNEKHIFSEKRNNWVYSYTPGLSFTEKIEATLDRVETDYVVMCADDDFIIPESLIQCASFLEQNKDYSIAQGLCIRYYKATIKEGDILYGLLYDFSNNIEANNPFDRLTSMFSNYHSVLYAVFKTEVLKQSFHGAGKQVKNLFLNEYLTAFLPILFGKYKELPILYQVREFAEDSDDKTAVDLDTMWYDHNFTNQLNAFRNFISDRIAFITNTDSKAIQELIKKILQSFSAELETNRHKKITVKKRIGKIINLIPFLGKLIISKNRKKEAAKQLESIIKTHHDREELYKISRLLLQFK